MHIAPECLLSPIDALLTLPAPHEKHSFLLARPFEWGDLCIVGVEVSPVFSTPCAQSTQVRSELSALITTSSTGAMPSWQRQPKACVAPACWKKFNLRFHSEPTAYWQKLINWALMVNAAETFASDVPADVQTAFEGTDFSALCAMTSSQRSQAALDLLLSIQTETLDRWHVQGMAEPYTTVKCCKEQIALASHRARLASDAPSLLSAMEPAWHAVLQLAPTLEAQKKSFSSGFVLLDEVPDASTACPLLY